MQIGVKFLRFLDYPHKSLIFINFVIVFPQFSYGEQHEKGADRIPICGTADPQQVSELLGTPPITIGIPSLR